MTLVNIDLRNVAGETGRHDQVVFHSPVHREGSAGQTIQTAPVIVDLEDGIGSVDLDPGPVVVDIRARGWEDTAPKTVMVPEEGPITLTGLMSDAFEWVPVVVSEVRALASRAESAAGRAESVADTFGSLEGVAVSVQAAEDAATSATGSATAAALSATAANDSEVSAASSATDAAQFAVAASTSATNAATSAGEAATHGDTSLDASAAAIAAAWSFDGFTPAQVADAALRAEDAADRAEASGGGIIVVSSEEEAAALPIGTVYVIAEVAPGNPVTIVGTVGENITTDTFTPTIPNATTGDTIIIAANTKAVGGSTLTAPAGFTTLVDGYWAGTQRSWVLTGPWSDDLTITADQPLEFGYVAVAVRGATSVTTGTIKDRGTEPAESTTVTAPAVEHGTNDLAIGIAFERTSADETLGQVTVNEGWTIEHYTAQGANFQTTLIGTGGTGDMVVTYPNPQATNGVGVQVVAHV